MKEFENKAKNLTNKPPTPYSKGEGISMSQEGGENMPQKGPQQPSSQERGEILPKASGDASADARELLKNFGNLPVEVRRAFLEALQKQIKTVERAATGRDESKVSAKQGENLQLNQEAHQSEGTENEPGIKDRRAADLIDKFKREGGASDKEKSEKLRLDLARRVQEIERQQDELGDREGARTPDGELTDEAAAAIDELSNQISQIQAFSSNTLPVPEDNRERSSDPEQILIRRTNEYVNGLQNRGLKISQINDLSNLTEPEKATRTKIVHDIKEFLENEPKIDTGNFPRYILLAVRHFKELREELVSEILFKSFEDPSETNEYEVGLYAASNLDILLGFMSTDDNSRYKELFTLRTASRFFQTMNSTIIKGTFDSFGHSAENINFQHFEKMRDIRGSGLAMRLYEQAYKDVLASDKRVTQEKIAGIKAFAEKTFKEINEAGLIKSEYADYRGESKMENWEVQRALAAGRSFLNITLRAAESIATGQVPSDRKRFTSPPQEDMVRILNWNQWMLGRFMVGGDKAGRHGEEFLQMSTNKFEEFLRYKGAKLDINKIVEFGGVDVRKMEEGGQYRTSGVYSSWRLENMAFDEIYFNYQGNRLSIQQFRDQSDIKDRIKVITDRIEKKKEEKPNADPKDLVTKIDQEEYKNILMPAVENLNIGLSMLLKNGVFGKQDDKLGYLLRTEIWKKIANTNIPLMIDYLTDIKYADGTSAAEKAQKIEALREDIVPGWSKEKWEDFRKKVLIRHERMIREGMGEEMTSAAEEIELDEAEKQLVAAIQREGAKLAPHLADIVFPYTPFMNDMPFEKFNYAYPGQTFYKRRTTGDLGGFNKGQQAYTKIMSNPGGIAAKDAVAAMGDIVGGIESPEGPRTAIEANFPTFSALLDVVSTDPGKRQAMFKMLLEATRTETSIAQRWAGIKADSFIEGEAANLIDDTLRSGILNPELARYLKKEKHLTLPYILWMLFRDVFVMIPVFAAAEFVGAVKGK